MLYTLAPRVHTNHLTSVNAKTMKKLLLSLSIASSLLLSAQSVSMAAEAPKSIVTSFYPLAYMAEQIVGDNAEVINLAGSVDVHDYTPSPRDLVKLNKSDLVLFQGAELEAWADDVIPGLKEKGVATFEVSSNLTLAKMEEHEDHHDDHEDEGEEKHSDEHHDKHEDKHEENHKDKHDDHDDDEAGHDEHHHGEYDPHTWLDPVLAQQMVSEILKSVLAIDSSNAAVYEANAEALKTRFATLDEAFKTGLANCANDDVIISHDAYGYLARRYGFTAHNITGISSSDVPSAKILADLKKEAAEGITHILIEENNIRRFADTLARETGLATLPANPLGRGTLDPKKDFFDVMEENLSSFKTALNCK
ncbi:hypothetical protein EOL70_02295 [Leucothrix sargassi]|nr:hypothetical protein EOL70_02295 [Leucothrix sargassi]